MKWIVIEASFLATSALMLDAFFAHGLKNYLGTRYDEATLPALMTASRYQLMAALFLLILFLFYRLSPSLWIIVSQICTSFGVLFFSFTIYLKYLFGITMFANLAPVGGISFMLAFLALIPLAMKF